MPPKGSRKPHKEVDIHSANRGPEKKRRKPPPSSHPRPRDPFNIDNAGPGHSRRMPPDEKHYDDNPKPPRPFPRG